MQDGLDRLAEAINEADDTLADRLAPEPDDVDPTTESAFKRPTVTPPGQRAQPRERAPRKRAAAKKTTDPQQPQG